MERDEVKQPDRSTRAMHAGRRSVLRIFAGGLLGLLVAPVADWRGAASWAADSNSLLQAIPRRPRPVTPSPALFTGKLAGQPVVLLSKLDACEDADAKI